MIELSKFRIFPENVKRKLDLEMILKVENEGNSKEGDFDFKIIPARWKIEADIPPRYASRCIMFLLPLPLPLLSFSAGSEGIKRAKHHDRAVGILRSGLRYSRLREETAKTIEMAPLERSSRLLPRPDVHR